MESMSFTYQHSSTSVSIATKPSSSRMLLDSDSDSEEEPLSCSHSPTEVDSTGDISGNCLVLFYCVLFSVSKLTLLIHYLNKSKPRNKSGSKHTAVAVNTAIKDMEKFA